MKVVFFQCELSFSVYQNISFGCTSFFFMNSKIGLVVMTNSDVTIIWVRCFSTPDLTHIVSISQDMLVFMHNAVDIQTMNHFK